MFFPDLSQVRSSQKTIFGKRIFIGVNSLEVLLILYQWHFLLSFRWKIEIPRCRLSPESDPKTGKTCLLLLCAGKNISAVSSSILQYILPPSCYDDTIQRSERSQRRLP